MSIEGKVFRIMLVDTDSFDEVKVYLKKLKYFSYGLAICTKTQRDFDIIYIFVKYTRKKTLDINKLNYCRIKKIIKLDDKLLKQMRDNGEVIWEEGVNCYEEPVLKQKKIDEFIITNEVSLHVK